MVVYIGVIMSKINIPHALKEFWREAESHQVYSTNEVVGFHSACEIELKILSEDDCFELGSALAELYFELTEKGLI